MNNIDLVAWWGAIVSTIVFGWDIFKWANKGAKLAVLTRCHVSYPDGRVTSVEQTAHGARTSLAEYCHIEVFNKGDVATTIISIEGSHEHKKSELQIGCSDPMFVAHGGKALPVVLAPGEMWSARFEMTHVEALAQRGRPYISIRSSHRVRPIRTYPKYNARPEI